MSLKIQPKYSVIIPIYNMEELLRRCIDSVIQQGRSDVEIILVDDGSNDDSGVICDEYVCRYDYIKVIHQSNQGLSGARNSGLRAASGEWILFLDSDDYISDDYFAVIDNAILKHPSDYYKFNYLKAFDDGRTLKNIFIIENDLVDISSEEAKLSFLTERLLTYYVGWEAPTGIYKKRIIDRYDLEFSDTRIVFAEDMLFSMKYILHAESVYLICNYLYMYYTRDGSLSMSSKVDSTLPRLFCLIKLFYDEVEPFSKMKRYFYRIYFSVINYHITHNLKDTDIEIVRRQIGILSSDRFFRKLNKKIGKDSILSGMIDKKRNWL